MLEILRKMREQVDTLEAMIAAVTDEDLSETGKGIRRIEQGDVFIEKMDKELRQLFALWKNSKPTSGTLLAVLQGSRGAETDSDRKLTAVIREVSVKLEEVMKDAAFLKGMFLSAVVAELGEKEPSVPIIRIRKDENGDWVIAKPCEKPDKRKKPK